jgi:hypothetical protein
MKAAPCALALSGRSAVRAYAAVLLLLALSCCTPSIAADANASSLVRLVRAVLQEPAPQPPYTLTACAIVNNERPYILEWVVYHRLVGFDHFLIYDNDSTDDTASALRAFIDKGVVEYKRWPGPKRAAQEAMLDDCFNWRNPFPSRWMAHFDIDEFLLALSQGEVSEAALLGKEPFILHRLLARFERRKQGTVVLDRMDFGTSGHAERPAGLVVQQYTNRLVKLCVRQEAKGKLLVLSEALASHNGAHDPPTLHPGWSVAFANGRNWTSTDFRVTFEPIRLNHYITRSYQECVDKANGDRVKSLPDSWRRELGKQLCDKNHPGTSLFYREEHAHDYVLLASPVFKVVAAVLEQVSY